MTNKIGPLQTGEEKPAVFDFAEEGISGAIVSATVTVSLKAGTDPDFEDVVSGSVQIDGETVVQKVVYQVPDAVYLIQCTATDSAGYKHTISAYLPTKAAA